MKPDAKPQLNIRLSEDGRTILGQLVTHFSSKSDTGRATTQTEVLERAIRALARQEKILEKSSKRT